MGKGNHPFRRALHARAAAGLALALALSMPFAGCRAQAPVEGYRVVKKLPHSTEHYTEGFFFLNGMFYEGTGLNGHSQVLAEDPATGRAVQSIDIPPEFFGEGIVNWGPNLLEWTWKSHVCFVYNRFSLNQIKTLTYSGEGWGMTQDGHELITSDGSNVLRFRDPVTFRETHHIDVHDGSHPVEQLNELEWVRGEIYANVWHVDRIARISPRDGHVIAWIDLTGLLPDSERVNSEAVLNGIAYDSQHDRLWVTGKQWPAVFEIKVVPKR